MFALLQKHKIAHFCILRCTKICQPTCTRISLHSFVVKVLRKHISIARLQQKGLSHALWGWKAPLLGLCDNRRRSRINLSVLTDLCWQPQCACVIRGARIIWFCEKLLLDVCWSRQVYAFDCLPLKRCMIWRYALLPHSSILQCCQIGKTVLSRMIDFDATLHAETSAINPIVTRREFMRFHVTSTTVLANVYERNLTTVKLSSALHDGPQRTYTLLVYQWNGLLLQPIPLNPSDVALNHPIGAGDFS